MDRWQHLHDVNKAITTLTSALLLVAVAFAKDFGLKWACAPLLLSMVYILFAVALVLSVLAMCFITTVLKDNELIYRNRAISTTNWSFAVFVAGMGIIALIGVIEAWH